MSHLAPQSFRPRDRLAKGLIGPRLTVVFFGTSGEVVKACEPLARDLPFARAEAKHLFAACTALDGAANAILVVSTTIRSWDRDVIEERARAAKAPLLWVNATDDGDDVVAGIERIIKANLRVYRAAPLASTSPSARRSRPPAYAGAY
jgi:hypothetical protein